MPDRSVIEKTAQWLLFIIGLSIFAALIHRIGREELTRMFLEARKPFWLCGLLVYFLSMVLRGLKWQILVSTQKSVRLSRFLPIYLFNAILGNMTPFRSGEVLGPFLFKRHIGLEIGYGVTVILIDRIIELVWMFVSLAIGFFYLATQIELDPMLARSIFIAGFITLVLIVLLISVIFSETWAMRLTNFLEHHVRMAAVRQRLDRIRIELKNIREFRSNPDMFRKLPGLNFLTALAWLAQFAAVWFFVFSLLSVSFMDSLTAQAIAIPISIISMIPAGIGIAALGYQVIMGLFGYPEAPVLGAVLLSKIMFLSLIFISGWISGLILKRNSAS